jgi:hypothetical protein
MTRLAHLGIGVALIGFCCFCAWTGFLLFIGLAVSKDSVPGASVFDVDFLVLYVVCGGVILVGLWAALASLKRAFRAPPRQQAVAAQRSAVPQHPLAPGSTPDERLAPLVRKEQK